MEGKDYALLAGVYATFALDVYSTLNSSPQTTELFAGEREESLMHWVKIGGGAAIAGGAIATVVTKNAVPLIATVGIVVLMHFLYRHAVKRGTAPDQPDD